MHIYSIYIKMIFSGKTTLFFNEYGMENIYFMCTYTYTHTHTRARARTHTVKFDLYMIICKGLYIIIYKLFQISNFSKYRFIHSKNGSIILHSNWRRNLALVKLIN